MYRVADDMREVRKTLKDLGLYSELLRLEHAAPIRTWSAVLLSWALILSSSYLVSEVSMYFLPLALVITASRQRALNNSIHEACHQTSKSWFAKQLLAAPMFESFQQYKTRHLKHHAKLGITGQDPDLVVLDDHASSSPGRAYWSKFRDREFFIENAIGSLSSMSAGELLMSLVFWLALLGSWALWLDPRAALMVLVIWFLSRVTVYHAIKSFTELADHFGLTPGGIVSFTRNSTSIPLGFLVHPHNDGYHLTHHLVPKVPLASLGRAHKLLLLVPAYAAGAQCSGYFLGSNSVITSWMARGRLSAPATPAQLSLRNRGL